MKKHLILLSTALALAACNSSETTFEKEVAEAADRIVEYTPAPGQFVNEPASGFQQVATPAAAVAYAEERIARGLYVSLGSWGGYLVARFDRPVVAGACEYDLWVRGNSFDGSSEPGVVWVMEDTNRNGEPDDRWYELRGSEYDHSVRDYEITYLRPENPSDDIPWSDNRGNTGVVARNSHHTQESYFPAWIATDRLILRGTLLPKNITQKADGTYVMNAFAWGYADNASTIDRSQGANRMRIADAVREDGTPARLERVDFIKVQTGINAARPDIGEISTEVCGIGCYRKVTEQ